jgi:enterochelin esterase-like enzyme
VYLPPQYGMKAYAHRRFPVVELVAGAGGGPTVWEQELHVQRIMDVGLRYGTLAPMILVMPTVTVAPPRDTECVNVSDGPQVETYLVHDVRAAIVRDFRATRNPAGWAMLGYSTGGYCATNILLRNPTLFHSGVSLSGYGKPYKDQTTGTLFANAADRDANTPIWRLTHLPQPRVSLLLMTSRDDPDSQRDSNEIVAEARAPLSVDEVTLQSAGHNFSVWRAEEPTALAWLSQRLSPPLASTPTVDGVGPSPS